MSFFDSPSAEALDRYLSGTGEPEERARVAQWIASLPSGERGLSMLRAMSPDDVRAVDVGQQWGLLTERIRETTGSPAAAPELVSTAHTPRTYSLRYPTSNTSRFAEAPDSRNWWRMLLIPVCAVVLLMAGWMTATRQLRTQLSTRSFSYTTGNGERARITLPDGSQVTLNVASRLEIPADFAAGNRTLSLHGEALFTVQHSSGDPFTVVTPSSTTRVLGTRFVVREYHSDTAATVAVQNGRVAVGKVVVAANEEVAVHQDEAEAVRPADLRRFGFERGTLILDGVTLKDAIPDLNRWFNARVQLGDPSLGSRVLSGDCTTGSVANLAELLELTFDIKVVRRGNILTLYSKDS